MARLIILSGCSGGGKSTLIEALRDAGEAVVEEPGRRVIAQERASGGQALPWIDMVAFLRRVLALSRQDFAEAQDMPGRVFLDRGLIDAAVAWEHYTGGSAASTVGAASFHRTAFLAPPWPEIYRADSDRRHGFAKAVAEYGRLLAAYPRLGYAVRLLPKESVSERCAFILRETSGP